MPELRKKQNKKKTTTNVYLIDQKEQNFLFCFLIEKEMLSLNEISLNLSAVFKLGHEKVKRTRESRQTTLKKKRKKKKAFSWSAVECLTFDRMTSVMDLVTR